MAAVDANAAALGVPRKQLMESSGNAVARAVRDVVLPIARPGIVTAAIFSFSAGWNNFLLAQIVLSDSEMYTLPVGAALLLGRDAGWETAMSVSVLICIPPFLIALFFQRYLMLGINIGESG
ncbi:MAG: hypothetical protein BRD24_03075 [Halobacteriales archaeon SW_9_67_24]|nr:MAG: hypothetical protein BRD24_03075 [Halobacteriales archaeon SW_9_67_24]